MDKINPQEGQFWRHRNGVMYLVLMITNEHSENERYQPQVVYRGANGKIWSRPLSDWHRSMTFSTGGGEEATKQARAALAIYNGTGVADEN